MDTHFPIAVIPPCVSRGDFQMEPVGKGVFLNQAWCMKRAKKVMPSECRVCVHDSTAKKG